jgi:mannose-6-phosphate isomerase-like protein (cupin superfamily)
MERERNFHLWPALAVFACMTLLHAQERQVDPTFLYRDSAKAPSVQDDMTAKHCSYKPLFGQGDKDASALVGIARYGEAIVDPGATCRSTLYPGEDQVYVVLDGSATVRYGQETVTLHKEDYLYLPATVAHDLTNSGTGAATILVMGFRTKGFEKAPLPPHPLKANIEDVPTQPVSGHPSSTLYRLLMGDVESNRDRVRAGRVLTSLFLMEITPGGTNFPHHHEREEEIYLVLSGHGTMVAGGGEDGIEGKHPAKAGDAYFFRLNCTVGYYSAQDTPSRILAVRSWYPGMQQKGVQH